VFHRINKSQPAIWRDPNTLQIGLGAKRVVIEDLTLAQQQIVAALYSGVSDGTQEVLDDTFKAEPGLTQSLMDQLSPVLESPAQKSNTYGAWQQLVFAELARTAIDYQVNPEMVMAERWQRVVHIDQLDRAGLLLAKTLLASGVGSVVTHDAGLILQTDLGEIGYKSTDLAKPRVQMAHSQLAELSLPKTTKPRLIELNGKPSKELSISFAVTIGHLALRPATYLRWLNRDVKHLGITFELNQTQISPIVIPGSTPCLNCLAEYKVDEDPAWPVLASQLLELPRTRDDSAALLSAIGLSLRMILRELDNSAGFVVTNDVEDEYRNGYVVQYGSGNVTRTKYAFHTLCNCRLSDN
jgi:hypothetical protein